MIVCSIIDASGVYGSLLHYGLVIAMVGSAFLIFCCLWKNKRLDMDEAPKFQMMDESDIHEQ